MNGAEDDFAMSVPAWRARRLRAHLATLVASGAAARDAGAPRTVPAEFAHRAEARCWLRGWGRTGPSNVSVAPNRLAAKQLARLARWQSGAGRLRPAQGALRRDILETVADEWLSARPLALGAIAAAHRETVRRCRDAGLPAPKASRYRRWLKLTGRVTGPAAPFAPKGSAPGAD